MPGAPHYYGKLDDTFYFWFASNDTSGSGDDGATPLADVRLAGAAAGAAPVQSPTPALLTHANFPAGLHEVAINASAGNGYANGSPNVYAVFCTLLVDAQNPSGFVGSFELSADGGIALRGSDGDTLKDLSDEIALIPTTAMRGTDSAALASVCTEARLAGLDAANLPSDIDDILALLDNKMEINKAASELWLYNAAGDTIIKKWPLTDKDGSTIVLQGTGPANRGVQSL